jgi:hypothetical protein
MHDRMTRICESDTPSIFQDEFFRPFYDLAGLFTRSNFNRTIPKIIHDSVKIFVYVL